jgi:hypothetical protein
VKPWIVPLLAACAFSASACTDHAAQSPAAAVPRASGHPSETEYAAIGKAATQLAQERSARACASVTDCGRATVFVDGKPVADALVAQVAQGLLLHDFGAQATAERLTSLMRDEKSAFLRRALTSTAYSALLRLDAASALTEVQRRAVEDRVKRAEQLVASGEIKVTQDPAGGSQPPTAAELAAYRATLRETFEEQDLTAAYAKAADPGKMLRDFIGRALGRHRVEFTPGLGLHDTDVLAFAAQAGAESRAGAGR